MRMTTIELLSRQKSAKLAMAADCPDAIQLPDGGARIDAESECYRAAIALPKPRKRGNYTPKLEGVGTELKKLFASLGVKPLADCKCDAVAQKMNDRGIEWCRKNRDENLEWLRKGEEKYGWATRTLAAAMAVKKGYARKPEFRCNPLAWFYDEAIRRAEAAQASSPAANNPA